MLSFKMKKTKCGHEHAVFSVYRFDSGNMKKDKVGYIVSSVL